MRFHKDHDMDLINDTVDMVKESLLKESNELSTLRILLNKTEVGAGEILLFYIFKKRQSTKPYFNVFEYHFRQSILQNYMASRFTIFSTFQENIRITKQKLDDLLRERKLEKLVNYIDLLNREENNIKNTFQSIADDHMNQYPDPMQADYYEQQLLKGW